MIVLVQSEIKAIRNANRLFFVERDMLIEKISIKDSIIGIQDGIISAYQAVILFSCVRTKCIVCWPISIIFGMAINKHYRIKEVRLIKWGGASLGLLFILALIF